MSQQSFKRWIYIIGLNCVCLTSAMAQTTEEQLLATANDIKQLVQENNNVTSSINAHSSSILDNIKSYLPGMNDYLAHIENYVKDIWNWLTQTATFTDNNSVRYIAWDTISNQVNTQVKDMEKKLDNLMQYGVYTAQVTDENKPADPIVTVWTTAAQRPVEIKNNGQTYSTLSASTLLSKDMYDPNIPKEQEAAENVVQNAAGGNIPLPTTQISATTTDQDLLEYAAYQKTMAAIQSFAANNLIRAYARRVPYNIKMGQSSSEIAISQARLFKAINTEDPSNQNFWLEGGAGHAGLIERVFNFLSAIFSVNYSLNHIADELERMNIQLSLLMTQNTFIVKGAYGDQITKRMTQKVAAEPLEFERNE